ncbi:MAG: LLM class flavin-dependent oxidoreductase [Chloroflexi bacterium]|nr:LLM class flavin-dependent oxidoreductase [Chloroflexota bacterium]
MADIKFGPIYTAIEDLMGPVELAEKCEAWGYDSFWVPDYVLKPRLDALTILSAVSQRTSRIQLGTAVLVLPYKHPLLLAKTALSVDVLSGGRLLLGVGIGADPVEFDVLGLDIRERGRISDERLEILSRVFTETHVTHQGRFHQFRDVSLGPPSIQKPHIPIWVGALWRGQWAEGAIRRTARYADAFVPAEATVEAYKEAIERISRQAEAIGRDPSTIEWALFLWLCMDQDREKARQKATKELGRRLGRKTEVEFGRSTALGTPQECIQVIEEYINIGVTHIVLDAGCPPEELVEQYQRAAQEIVPHFKSVGT